MPAGSAIKVGYDGRVTEVSWNPFWLVVTDGIVTGIEEQYTP